MSHFALSKIETCSWAYKLRSVDHVKGAENDRNFCVGGVIDELVDDWFSTAGCELGWMQKHADEYYARYLQDHRIVWRDLAKSTLAKEKVSNDRQLLHARIRKWVPKTEATLIRAGLPDLRRLQAQRKFNVAFPGNPDHRLIGALDFFDHEERTIYELKISKNKEILNKDQILLYVAAITARDKERVNRAVFLSPLMRPAIREVEFTYYEVRGVLLRALKAIDLVQRGDFKPVGKSRPCYNCEFRGPLCPVWSGRAIPDAAVQLKDTGMRRVSL